MLRVLLWTAFLLIAGLPRTSVGAPDPADATALVGGQPALIRGAVYDRRTRTNLLFHFRRVATNSAEGIGVVREFTYPDGRVAAREILHYRKGQLWSFELEEIQTGAYGRARLQGGDSKPQVLFEFTPDGQKPALLRKGAEELLPNTLAGDMLMPFIAEHWKELAKGKRVKCHFLVLHRLETIGFAFSKEREATLNGHPVTIVRLEPSNMFLSAIVDPLFFTVESKAPHRVLSYFGRTTPKLRQGQRWVDVDAYTVFYWDPSAADGARGMRDTPAASF